MNLRRITSLTAMLSFIVMILTSIILYIVPQGRVAYWADWRLWGLSKEQWGAIHINVGFLFLFALGLHLYYNWKPVVNYLKNKSKKVSVFTPNFNAALVITLLFVVGTLVEVPPFSTIIGVGDSIKDAAAVKYGEPPYGHAELSSFSTFAKKMGIDAKSSLESLKKSGYRVGSPEQTLKEIAEENRTSPQQIYKAMVDYSVGNKEKKAGVRSMPDSPPAGTGNRTLADICAEYRLDLKKTLRMLKEKNMTADAEMTIKKIGEVNEKSPVDIYEIIKAADK